MDEFIPVSDQEASNRKVRETVARLYKQGDQEKTAILDKAVNTQFEEDLPKITDSEPDLPDDVIKNISDKMSDGLSTAGATIIVIKPKEFQRSFLGAFGHGELADQLSNLGIGFNPGAPPTPGFSLSGQIIPELLSQLINLSGERSAAPLHLNKRILTMCGKGAMERQGHDQPGASVRIEITKGVDHPLLNKISSAYTSYRLDLIKKAPELIKSASRFGDYNSWILDQLPRSGPGICKVGSSVVEYLLGANPVSYLYRAYLP